MSLFCICCVDPDGLLQGVDGEMQVSKRRRRRALLQDGKHSPNTQFDMGLLQQTSDATEPCTESIMCAPEWEEVAHGVVSIYAINTRIRALGLCTGTRLLLAAGVCAVHAAPAPVSASRLPCGPLSTRNSKEPTVKPVLAYIECIANNYQVVQ